MTTTVISCELKREPCATCKFSFRQFIRCEYAMGGARLGHTCGRINCKSCGKRVGERDYCGVHASIVEKELAMTGSQIPRTILRFKTGRFGQATGPGVYNISHEDHQLEGVFDLDYQDSWDCGRPYAIPWAGCGKDEYIHNMRLSWKNFRPQWNMMLSESTATFVCECMAAAQHCHRTWLAEILVKLGATHMGDLR